VAEAAPEPAREPAPPKAKPSGKTYAVKKGDTVLGIARKLGIPAADLAAVNPGVDSARLSLGQELRIPQKRKR
jgi:LysM repeat protein